ncbi:MAG: B12-binding domain-containing radical SAM protein [Candidatus Omnitrophica bacterium]|nr:B12-binding domain-containing radical SAM protein [Candidatus Omnitrophota bacterium]
MKVSLIRPPVYGTGLMGAQLVPFLGILYVASALRAAGHEVDVIDMCAEGIDRLEVIDDRFVQYGLSFDDLRNRLKSSDVIGFACMFSQDWPFHRRLISYVAKIASESVIFAGGEHVTALPEFCLEDCLDLDYCILGEGECSAVAFLDALSSGLSLDRVPSIVARKVDGAGFLRTARLPRICNVDKIQPPAWDLIPLENYLSRGLNYHLSRGRTIPVIATRGCPYQCTFCSNARMWGHQWVERSASKLLDEIEGYVDTFKADNFVFSDLTAVVSATEMQSFCKGILDRNLKFTWQLPTLRTEALDKELLSLMFKAGCRELDVAIESGSKKVLESVNKRNDPRRMARVVRAAVSVGMNVSTNIVIGLPDEKWMDLWRSYVLLMTLAVQGMHEVNVFPFVPYPGSKLFYDLLEQKRIKLDDAFFFSLFGYADLSRSVSWSDNFNPRVLGFMRIFFMASFYCVMFVTHPVRLARFIANAIRGRSTTKLEGVIKRVFKNLRASSFRKDGNV